MKQKYNNNETIQIDNKRVKIGSNFSPFSTFQMFQSDLLALSKSRWKGRWNLRQKQWLHVRKLASFKKPLSKKRNKKLLFFRKVNKLVICDCSYELLTQTKAQWKMKIPLSFWVGWVYLEMLSRSLPSQWSMSPFEPLGRKRNGIVTPQVHLL